MLIGLETEFYQEYDSLDSTTTTRVKESIE